MHKENTLSLVGPLGKEYCFYFYLIAIFCLISFVLFFMSGIFIGVSQKKGGMYFVNVFAVSLLYAIGYLQARLLFQMCTHTL